MKILILTGSPRTKGTTALLAEQFAIGAKEAGHDVVRFDTAKLNIKPCQSCYSCRKSDKNDSKCAFNDDMTAIYPEILSADMIVFVTPVYYFGISAQLKSAIDRFFAINTNLRESHKKAILLAAGGDEEGWAMTALKLSYETICRYLNMKDMGQIIALGCYQREDMENSGYPEIARKLGQSIK
ncbi:MAG: flavodoxin family protein [Intestinibacter sp.]